MVNVIVAQLLGHSRGTTFYSQGTRPVRPHHLGAVTPEASRESYEEKFAILPNSALTLWSQNLQYFFQFDALLFNYTRDHTLPFLASLSVVVDVYIAGLCPFSDIIYFFLCF